MKTLVAIVSVVVIAMTIVVISPAAGQSDIETRVANLETRVAKLESDMASPSPSETAQTQSPASYTIEGLVALGQSKVVPTLDGGCIPSAEVTDPREGTEVTLRDETSKIIGSSVLGAGTMDKDLNACVFRFEIREVPESRFYVLTIGELDDFTYSLDEMISTSWQLLIRLV
jgi:hypothetical protein